MKMFFALFLPASKVFTELTRKGGASVPRLTTGDQMDEAQNLTYLKSLSSNCWLQRDLLYTVLLT